ncbi:IS110 family transposase [Ochrobactrum sp. MYb15]|nr:IS110 family transposase [Ochrobactrum sp. MYb19]PRA61066.1 IS110 family transposase [Ochrobactrum sp. MYb18]PRA74772.1 IS110 family transposase [Brucella thiophenivorans]PRA86244.1 IS110 family transposase [Ochrobactrum sp. MYb14]PRA95702.1 IS110 family transposase [Ochrobactrum sp. MYb15]
MTQITTIGLDLAKNVFQVHGVDANGQVLLRKTLRRSQMLAFFEQLRPCLIGIKACATAHYWARTLQSLGHEVRLISPTYVKPYVKRQKNDVADAAAICEAVSRPSMRFAPVKSVEQQSHLMLHSARELLITQRTALINALRAHFSELGIVAAEGARNVRNLLNLLEQQKENVTETTNIRKVAITALQPLAEMLLETDKQIAKLDREILALHRDNGTSNRLATIPGIGVLTATYMTASLAAFANQFSCGREFAAYLGLVPRQYSSGGKPRLGRISKMGNRHLRKLLVVGATAALYSIRKGTSQSALAVWARQLLEKKPFRLVAVALANKMARIAWAVIVHERDYQADIKPNRLIHTQTA